MTNDNVGAAIISRRRQGQGEKGEDDEDKGLQVAMQMCFEPQVRFFHPFFIIFLTNIY